MDCGLYIHIPFCETKCGYCDFYSVPLKDRSTRPLVDAVVRELHHRLADDRIEVRTVFIGGGTPTLLEPPVLEHLLNEVSRALEGHKPSEFTVEANPATVDEEKTELLVGSGVNRVSMGAQSFVPSELAALERLHSPDDIAPSVRVLREGGIREVNLDLIFGIPGQTIESWDQSLERAIALQPDHVACYGLTYEPGTRLTAQKDVGSVVPCDEAEEARMYERTIDRLAQAGFEQYEISNFARPGFQCRHNLMYWRNEPYVGVGPSAAGCIERRRYKNVANIGVYIGQILERDEAVADEETLDDEMLLLEMVMMQLRLVEGMSIEAFRQRLGQDPRDVFGTQLAKLESSEWISVNDDRIALTRQGRPFTDRVITDLVSKSPADTPLPVLRTS